MILGETTPKKRSKIIIKFIKIAKMLQQSHNFNTLMAVLSALLSTSVSRLAQTQKYVVEKGKDAFTSLQELNRLMSSEKSFKIYRQALKSSELPCVPYLYF